MLKSNSEFNPELYQEMCEDTGCQYDAELYDEIKEYYLQQQFMKDNRKTKCDGCSAYKYCDVVISSIKLCNNK